MKAVKILFVSLLFSFTLCAQVQMKSSVISSGASTMNSGNLLLKASIGQTVTESTNTSILNNAQGFWNTYRSQFVVNTNTPQASFIKFYPNPVQKKAYIKLNYESEDFSSIKIIDVQGKVVYSDNILLQGATEIELDIEHLAEAFYFLHLIGNKVNAVIPFSKKQE
jgi:hypothetical protein